MSSFGDSTEGDNIEGEDLTVRRAAVDALGPFNGSVVVSDAQTGRILTMVNQDLALKGGFIPCSTVKVFISFASLLEGIVDHNTPVRLYGRTSMTMTEALAYSNNRYFATLGERLGFEKVVRYSKMFGLGEKAGYNIEGEVPGTLPAQPPTNGGVGMMSSFGEGIRLTPLELAAMVGAVANGGTLHYLQYPKTDEEVENFTPRVKRDLKIGPYIPEVKPGMMGAVEYGTARRASYNNTSETIFGKTGTCTDRNSPTHMGWFGSFNDTGNKKLVVVVMLTGGRQVSGPIASGVAGNVYKNLADKNYFGTDVPLTPASLISTQSCCSK